jgi:D-proline reductase (dithiol) PrdB
MLKRTIHRGISFLAARIPALADKLVASFRPMESEHVPWTKVAKPLEKSKFAIVTTAGVHHRNQSPFDMADSNGDPSFRILDAETIESDYTITHDYYDHKDARQDLNVVFPIARLAEMRDAGCIGAVAQRHISFMGHIDGPHVRTLMNETAPKAAALLKKDGVDAVLLTPA